MIDYALHHEAVSDLVRSPDTREGWEALALGPERVADFERDGFLSGIRVFDEAQVERLRGDLARLAGPAPPGRDLFYEYHANESQDPETCLFHALGAWRASPLFHDVLWAPVLRIVCHQLLGGKPIRFLHDQLFCKPAGHGGIVAWHQDYSYWTWTTPMAHLTCWIALDDVDEDNGCLWYVPRSHTWPDLPVTGLTGDMDAVREVLNEAQLADFEARVPIRLKRGQAAFHHPRTLHGSFANTSDRPRRATLVNVVRDGVCSAIGPDDPDDIASRYHTPPHGEPLSGTFYPLLFDPLDLGVELPATAVDE
jgi:hypothetical protein